MRRFKRCPFCGGKANLYENYMGHTYVVQCDDCGIGTLNEITPEEAARKWNQRSKKKEEKDMSVKVLNIEPPRLLVKVKKVLDDHNQEDIKIPAYMHDGDACFDFYAPEKYVIPPTGLSFKIRTGLAFEIPEGYHLKLFMRSSYGAKRSLRLSNCVGIVDSSYRGEVIGIFDNIGDQPEIIEKGDRFLQGMIERNTQPPACFKEVTKLSVTGRGDGGLGSTGR